jgi:hypothetical protein
MLQRASRVVGVLMILIVVLAISAFAENRADELDRVIYSFQRAIQESELVSWSTDTDVLIAESLGARFGWESFAYRLVGNGELEVLCPATARVFRMAAELGVTNTIVSSLGGFMDIGETDYYNLSILRAWILDGLESGLLSGDIYTLSLAVVEYALDVPQRMSDMSVDESLFEEYSDYYRDVPSLEWIRLIIDGGIDAVKSHLSVFWEVEQLNIQPGYETNYIDVSIVPMLMNWFVQRSVVLNQDMPVALEQARLEQDELSIILTGTLESVDYFGNPLQESCSGFVVSLVSGEKTLASSLVHQDRFVLNIPGKELAMNYPNRLSIALDGKEGSPLSFFLYEALPASVAFGNHWYRWLSNGLVVFAQEEPVKVQLVRDLVRFEVVNSDLTPAPGVIVTIQDVQLPANSEGIVEVEGMSAGKYSVIAGLASEIIDVTYGSDPLVIQIVLPREDEILSVPEEPRNHFADMTAELLRLEQALIDGNISLPDFFTCYNSIIRKAKEESMWLAAAWSRYKDIRERNLYMVLKDQDEGTVEELSADLSRELARINAQWFAGQEEFLKTADEVLQKYLAKRVDMIRRLSMLEGQVSNLVRETESLKTSVATETTYVLEGLGKLKGSAVQFAASSMKRDVLEEGREYIGKLAGNIEDAAMRVQDNVYRLETVLDELFQCAREYERLYETVTGDVVGPDAVTVYREGLGVLRKGEALHRSNYMTLLNVYGKEVLAHIEEIISDSNSLTSISTAILSRVSELPVREELDEISQRMTAIQRKAELIFEHLCEFSESKEDDYVEAVSEDGDVEQVKQAEKANADIQCGEGLFEQETMSLDHILQLFKLLDDITELRQNTVSVLEKDGVYGSLNALLAQGKALIETSEYIFDDVLKEWEQAVGFVTPVLDRVSALRDGLLDLENSVLLALDYRLEHQQSYEALYNDGMEFAEKLKKEIEKLRIVADAPAEYAEDEAYQRLTGEYHEVEDEYTSRWTGLMALLEIDDAWREFNLAYDYSGVEEARRALEERREALANLEVIELVFNTNVDLGIDFAAGKTVPFSSVEITDLEIFNWDEPRAFVPEGSGIRDLGVGTLSSQFELSSGSYLDALYLQEGHVYVIKRPDAQCAKLRVDEIVRVRRSIAGKLTSTQYTIKLSYLYPIPEQLFQ